MGTGIVVVAAVAFLRGGGTSPEIGASSVAQLHGGSGAVRPTAAIEQRPGAAELQILSITGDGLVAYKKIGGPDGATLRYSTGDPVRPEDFWRGLERAIALNEYAAGVFGAIDGAETCARRKAGCDLSGSVTVHLARPDPVDAITWRFGEDVGGAFDRLKDGTLDWMGSRPSPQDLASLSTAHPERVTLSAGLATMFVGVDAVKPPFDDVRVRRGD